MPLNGTQSIFAHALLSHRAAPPALRLAGSADSLALRFGVYRNNVFASLIAVLRARFSVVQSLVGADFFNAMAGEFVSAHPPKSPVMLAYGGEFPGFVSRFAPAKDIPYLGDVARFEWERHEAGHAADAETIALTALSSLDQKRLGDARLALHPAARLFASDYPVVSIWRINTQGVSGSSELSGAEAALITRPDLSVQVHDLASGAFTFMTHLASGETLAAAAAAAAHTGRRDFDLPATLAQIFSAGAIAGVSI